MKRVKSIQDGGVSQEYDSISNAADDMGVDESSIRKAINRKGRCCGMYWELLDDDETEDDIEMYGEEEVKPAFEDLWNFVYCFLREE